MCTCVVEVLPEVPKMSGRSVAEPLGPRNSDGNAIKKLSGRIVLGSL